jgi:uncharacterized protein
MNQVNKEKIMTEIPIIDADGHVLEDLKYIRSRLPKGSDKWPVFPSYDPLHLGAVTSQEGTFHRVGAEGYVSFMDEVGISTSVIYPTLGLAYGQITMEKHAVLVTKAYNNWLAETYLNKSSRLKGMAILPFQVPRAGVPELKRAVNKLNMLGAVLPPSDMVGVERYGFWPIYRAANKLGCAIAFHSGCHNDLGLDNMNAFTGAFAMGHPRAQESAFSSLLVNGIFDRFPNVRFGFLEGGVSWLQTVLERFDRATLFKDTGPRYNFGNMKPSEYIKSHIEAGRIFIGCEGDEEDLPHVISRAGNPFVYSSDFSHEVTPNSCRREIDELLGHPELGQKDIEDILFRNAERFYGLSVTL